MPGTHPERDKFKRKKGDTKMAFNNENKKTEKKAPTLAAYHVREGKNGGKSFWTRIGAAWQHEDGEGFNVQIEVMPLDGKIVLRAPKADNGESA
jgi:hypothetical protein